MDSLYAVKTAKPLGASGIRRELGGREHRREAGGGREGSRKGVLKEGGGGWTRRKSGTDKGKGFLAANKFLIGECLSNVTDFHK